MRLKTCCGCCSVQRGTQFIGCLSAAFAVLFVILMGLQIRSMHGIQDFSLRLITVCLLIYSIINGGIAATMIYGVYTRKPGFVFPWLAHATSNLLVSITAGIGFIVIGFTIFSVGCYFSGLAIFVVNLGLQCYIWLIVYSCYQQFIDEKYSIVTPPDECKIINQPHHNV